MKRVKEIEQLAGKIAGAENLASHLTKEFKNPSFERISNELQLLWKEVFNIYVSTSENERIP